MRSLGGFVKLFIIFVRDFSLPNNVNENRKQSLNKLCSNSLIINSLFIETFLGKQIGNFSMWRRIIPTWKKKIQKRNKTHSYSTSGACFTEDQWRNSSELSRMNWFPGKNHETFISLHNKTIFMVCRSSVQFEFLFSPIYEIFTVSPSSPQKHTCVPNSIFPINNFRNLKSVFHYLPDSCTLSNVSALSWFYLFVSIPLLSWFLLLFVSIKLPTEICVLDSPFLPLCVIVPLVFFWLWFQV